MREFALLSINLSVLFGIIFYISMWIADEKISYRQTYGGNFIYHQSKIVKLSLVFVTFFFGNFLVITTFLIGEGTDQFLLFLSGICCYFFSLMILNIKKVIINRDFIIIERLFLKDIKVTHKETTHSLKYYNFYSMFLLKESI